MTLSENAVIFVERAEHVGDFRLRLTFSNAAQQMVDFAPFLRRTHNPLIQAYLDPAAFARFTVKDGDLYWDDYDLCFPIADLYEGRPSRGHPPRPRPRASVTPQTKRVSERRRRPPGGGARSRDIEAGRPP